MNEYLQYIILAIIQGIAEILPISSSAHLLLASKMIGLPAENLTLSIFLHLGSAMAVFFFFRKRIYELIKGFFNHLLHHDKNKKEFHEVILLVFASIPAAVVGLLFKDFIEKHFLSLFAIGASLTITGFFLLYTAKKTESNKNLFDLKYRKGLSIGLFQAIGVLPGISRSGITYLGAKLHKLNAKDTSEFIFLMFLPVSIGSGILEIIKLFGSSNSPLVFGPLFTSSVIVILLTFFSLKVFLLLIKKEKMYYFSYYLLPLGLLLMCGNLY